MVDIVHPHCKVEGCTTLASFNMPGESRGEYCSQHKLVCDHTVPFTIPPVSEVLRYLSTDGGVPRLSFCLAGRSSVRRRAW